MIRIKTLRQLGNYLLNCYFLTVLLRAVFRTRPKVFGGALFQKKLTPFTKSNPPQMFDLVPKMPFLPVKKKRYKLHYILHNFT